VRYLTLSANYLGAVFEELRRERARFSVSHIIASGSGYVPVPYIALLDPPTALEPRSISFRDLALLAAATVT